MSARELEIESNFQFFQSRLASIPDSQLGYYAVIKSREIVGIYPTLAEAANVAHLRFGEAEFSIQEVTSGPLDLGFYSHANPDGGMFCEQ